MNKLQITIGFSLALLGIFLCIFFPNPISAFVIGFGFGFGGMGFYNKTEEGKKNGNK